MAKRISDDMLDQIHEEIYRRETVDYTEEIEYFSSESESNDVSDFDFSTKP